MALKHTYFTEDSYLSDIDLETNEDVLIRIYGDDVQETDKLEINFAFVTDTHAKALAFAKAIKLHYKEYSKIEVDTYNELFEILGMTDKIQMSIEPINKWNKIMWDFGYLYDCKLDGWYVGV